MKFCDYGPRDCIQTTSFSSLLTKGSSKLECLFLATLSSIVTVTLWLIWPRSVVNMAPGTVYTTLHFLLKLRMGQISQHVYPQQAFLAQCQVTLQLIWPKSVMNVAPVTVFATLHFLLKLRMGQISQSVFPQQALLAQSKVTTLQLIWLLHKFGRYGSALNITSGTVFAKLHFLHNI